MILTDRDAIRAILQTDALWAAYAQGDLAPGFFEHASWHTLSDDPTSLAMVLRKYDRPVIYLQGAPDSAPRLLEEIGPQTSLFYLIRREDVPALRQRYHIEKADVMWRMSLNAPDFICPSPGLSERLELSQAPAIETLLEDGRESGERPDFFYRSMLAHGIYYGVWEEGELVAAAGTHLFEPTEGIGAIGNVYTRRDRRGLGYASATVGSVAAELLNHNIPTIVLNVHHLNGPARRVYERLGFRPHCLFEEGNACLREEQGHEQRD